MSQGLYNRKLVVCTNFRDVDSGVIKTLKSNKDNRRDRPIDDLVKRLNLLINGTDGRKAVV